MKDKIIKSSELSTRHVAEEQFHDLKYSEQANCPYHYRLNPTYSIFQEMKGMLGDVRGKRILECGCGEGWTTAEVAALGGEIDSFDISSVAIEHAKRFLEKREIGERCTLQKMAAENLGYADEYFDIVMGFAILHHLDLSKALPEILRVMKKGGTAFFAEPLGTNPIINLYRRLTPQFRTEGEKPLILDEFRNLTESFAEFTHNEFYLTALLPIAFAYLRLPEYIITHFKQACLSLDKRILERFPFLGKYAWYTIIRLVK